ncbi:MAG TPA: lipopolysaccharide heptosyltransferase II [Chthoniobacterales bacterium]|jgi:lipopolysaccharide heptosyltransferase II
MARFSYGLFLAIIWLLQRLPADTAFRLGQLVGTMGFYLAFSSRRMALKNLTIAFGREKSAAEIRQLAREHFRNLLANIFVIPALSQMSQEEVSARVSLEGFDVVQRIQAAGQGVIWAGNHMGNWEMIPQALFLFGGMEVTAVYQKLGNPYLDEHVKKTRGRFGLRLVERKEGFQEVINTVRNGGIVGILIDQHAGDAGVWTPFFGKLASTTPMPALLAARSGGALVPLTVQTTGIARWKMIFEEPLPQVRRDIDQATAQLNLLLEKQIRRSPHESFWVHDRWKIPSPEFLLGNTKRYRRGIVLPTGTTAADLQPFRLLVRSSNWLGDAIMTVPAVRAMKHGRPDLHLTILCREKLVDLWKLIPEVDQVIGIRAGQSVFSVARKLRGKFETGVILPNSMRSVLEMWLAGLPRRAGYDRQGRKFLLDQIIKDPKRVGPPEHQSLHYLRLAETIGANLQHAEFPQNLRQKPPTPIRLGLCPGAEYGPAKRWLPERFTAVAQAVAQRRNCEWLIFGTGADSALGETMAAEIGASAKNLAGKTSLQELIETLSQCTALLTNDTGTMHLAALLGVPTISVFGSTEPLLTGPMGPNHRIVRHHVECSPCFLRECPIDFRCMNGVLVDQVVEAVLKTIDG